MTKHPLIYLPVSVEKELPHFGETYFVIDKMVGKAVDEMPLDDNYTETWLKPTPNVYVLTEDELLHLKKKWCEEAWNKGAWEEQEGHNAMYNDDPKNDYLNNLKL